jgi:hypothetical protein
VLRVALLLLFAWLVGRFWHPYHGFTQFLQIDPGMAAVMVPSLREGPVFVQPERGAYDGGYYAQVATSPGLRDPALKNAIDDAGYRARRILLPAAAWVLGGGEPLDVVHAYAWLNIGLWFIFAAVLWRALPAGDLRANLAWALLLFGAGVLYSVRFALTDLAAGLLAAGTVLLIERGRATTAAALVGLAGLARETGVLGLAALWSHPREWLARPGRTLGWLALGLLPLVLWLTYVRSVLGSSGAGQGNFTWPLAGWLARWGELWRGWQELGNRRLVLLCLLEHIALTGQVVYLVAKPRLACPWWRLGAANLLLFVFLGHAVWGGFDNAATRVLLPLTLAFNLRVVRDRARYAWLLLGNLSLFAGVYVLSLPTGAAHQLPAHGSWENRQVLETDARWTVAEWNSKHRWAWCADRGGLVFRTWPHRASVRLELEVRGVTPRELQVTHAGRVVWQGAVGDRPQWITLPELPLERGRLDLELASPVAPQMEGEGAAARRLGFACFGARLAP